MNKEQLLKEIGQHAIRSVSLLESLKEGIVKNTGGFSDASMLVGKINTAESQATPLLKSTSSASAESSSVIDKDVIKQMKTLLSQLQSVSYIDDIPKLRLFFQHEVQFLRMIEEATKQKTSATKIIKDFKEYLEQHALLFSTMKQQIEGYSSSNKYAKDKIAKIKELHTLFESILTNIQKGRGIISAIQTLGIKNSRTTPINDLVHAESAYEKNFTDSHKAIEEYLKHVDQMPKAQDDRYIQALKNSFPNNVNIAQNLINELRTIHQSTDDYLRHIKDLLTSKKAVDIIATQMQDYFDAQKTYLGNLKTAIEDYKQYSDSDMQLIENIQNEFEKIKKLFSESVLTSSHTIKSNWSKDPNNFVTYYNACNDLFDEITSSFQGYHKRYELQTYEDENWENLKVKMQSIPSDPSLDWEKTIRVIGELERLEKNFFDSLAQKTREAPSFLKSIFSSLYDTTKYDAMCQEYLKLHADKLGLVKTKIDDIVTNVESNNTFTGLLPEELGILEKYMKFLTSKKDEYKNILEVIKKYSKNKTKLNYSSWSNIIDAFPKTLKDYKDLELKTPQQLEEEIENFENNDLISSNTQTNPGIMTIYKALEHINREYSKMEDDDTEPGKIKKFITDKSEFCDNLIDLANNLVPSVQTFINKIKDDFSQIKRNSRFTKDLHESKTIVNRMITKINNDMNDIVEKLYNKGFHSKGEDAFSDLKTIP
ncbi:MAG: hypothetical protein ACMXYK_01945 [Candidatus Woesearchaeota archaeon]